MENYEKKLGRFTICADGAPQSKGRTIKGRRVIAEDYDSSYDEIFTLKNLCVKDENGKIVSPIIENIEIKNDGYCVTWSQLYWIQGYAVIDDSIYFIGLGEEGSYNVRDQVFHVLNGKGINEKVSCEHFIEKMISISTKPILPLSENTFSDEIDIIMGYMLF
jgi:hypothetical protein